MHVELNVVTYVATAGVIGGVALVVISAIERKRRIRLGLMFDHRFAEETLEAIRKHEAESIAAGEQRRQLLRSRGTAQKMATNLTSASQPRRREKDARA
ncbi:MAG: hypothetical protein ACRD1H_09135 [Vicinamibacterales bacterium]